MFSTQNKPFIDKCILSFSHNKVDSRLEANRMSVEKAQREIAAGKKGISHLILRAQDDEIDQLKFLFLIHGIPLMCYALANLLQSSLKEIVVIGSPEVEQVLNRFLEVVPARDKKITFVHEDTDNLSLINTMRLGRNQLAIAPNELILFQPGDLPFMYDLEKVLQDKDIEHNNLILWLNSKQKMFPRFQEDPDSEFVQRNYHYRAIYEDINELHDMKEPNVYPINLTEVNPDIINNLHSSRKDGKILRAGLKQALGLPSRFLKLLPVMIYHLRRFNSDLKRFREKDEFQFGMHVKNFQKGASILLNTTFKAKWHEDPSFVSDVDALEDWEDFESLTHYADQLHGEDGLAHIHPFGGELLRFREQGMPKLKNELPMYHDFPAYINRIHQTLQMKYMPFDSRGNYVSPSANAPRTKTAYHWYKKKCEE
jgi:CTP:molybdopterin cytidylyltransferase MocA